MDNGLLSIVTTADGSKSIFNSAVGENYHSKHGALQESKHVFLNAGLVYYLQDLQHNHKDSVSILEVGFGTGLNFLLSADHCIAHNIKLNYTGIEAYPLSTEMITQTGYEQYISEPVWNNFREQYADALKNTVRINDYSQLQVAHTKLLNFGSSERYDVIYFDAFASLHQPEMWNEDAISHTIKFLKPGGVFVTYAITGNLKRMLKGLGLKVEKAPGAPGKREMLRAIGFADEQI